MPSIAVILPTRNRFAMLQRTLRSLEAQTFKDFTVYVSDDASTDETKDHAASSFSGLNLRWTRRAERFPDIATHFSALYSEATEEWIALAHDDEVYAPEWLETLIRLMKTSAPSGKPVVMAQVGTVVVDARFGAPQFYQRRDQIPEGVYTADELKRLCLFDGMHFATNGFMVTREAALQTGAFRIEYEQFDFEWLMRLAQSGVTVCTTQLLHTYTMHPQNTVGSAAYLRRYFEQRNPAVMEQEWLNEMSDISDAQRSQRLTQLVFIQEKSLFRSFLKLLSVGDRSVSVEVALQLRAHRSLSNKHQLIVDLLMMRPLCWIAGTIIRWGMRGQSRRSHPSLLKIEKGGWIG